MIGAQNNLTNLGHRYHNFGSSSFTNNDTENLDTVIAALRIQQSTICEFSRRILHKDETLIICGPKLISPIIRRKMIQFNALHGD